MSNFGSVIAAAIVALVVSVGGALIVYSNLAVAPQAPLEQTSGDGLGGTTGPVQEQQYVFKNGIGLGGQFVHFTANGEIPAGSNQGAWRNTTGRTVYVSPSDVSLGYESGTASSSYNFYVGTSTSATYSDYSRPSKTTLLIDGATFATSTNATAGPIAFVGTSTNAGWLLAVPTGSYVVFDVQEKFACKTVGACETATSTNRGITKFFYTVSGRYKP